MICASSGSFCLSGSACYRAEQVGRESLAGQWTSRALAFFARVGVQIKILSGDHPQTVAPLARQVGISEAEQVVTGAELEQMDERQWSQAAQETTIFARITPHQKERLVQTLREGHHYVAMLGDGVNDLLSLKQADLGIAMESGSQATRAVADMVLLGDWRPTLLAASLLLLYLGIIVVPPLRAFFSLTVLLPIDSLFIGGVAVLWSFIQRWLWQARVLERVLHLNRDTDLLSSAACEKEQDQQGSSLLLHVS